MNKYYSRTGLKICIWPKQDWMTNAQYISTLKNVYGFSYFGTYHDYILTAENNGFPLSNIMALVDAHFPQQIKESYNQAGTRGHVVSIMLTSPITSPLHFLMD